SRGVDHPRDPSAAGWVVFPDALLPNPLSGGSPGPGALSPSDRPTQGSQRPKGAADPPWVARATPQPGDGWPADQRWSRRAALRPADQELGELTAGMARTAALETHWRRTSGRARQ